ncbi:MAG: helix-turn-helix domain-containing protein, partial [Bacilli bacterium]|nr:helix-turn-helix domain-containing protein [Bacilli bacterium]
MIITKIYNMISVGSILKEYLEDNKISQTEFAEMYNLSKKHVNEIINGKTGISLDTLILISLVTDNDINVLIHFNEHKKCEDELNDMFKSNKDINKFFEKFNLKEMEEKKWIKLRHIEDSATTYMDLKKFFKTNNLDNYFSYVKNNYYFKEAGEKDLIKTCEWINYCNSKIDLININKYIPENNYKLLEELKIERCNKFDKDRLIKLFNKYGIILFIEDTLKGSKVRGCTRVKVDTPVIYMSTYLKNKHSFYYALYHELSHIMSDYMKLKKQTIIHDDDIESHADKKALDMMIPNHI